MNCTRAHEPEIDSAMARARLVLPTPGASSRRMWPSDTRPMRARLIWSCLPRIAWPMLPVRRANVSANQPMSPSDAPPVPLGAIASAGAAARDNGSVSRRRNPEASPSVIVAVSHVGRAPVCRLHVSSRFGSVACLDRWVWIVRVASVLDRFRGPWAAAGSSRRSWSLIRWSSSVRSSWSKEEPRRCCSWGSSAAGRCRRGRPRRPRSGTPCRWR